MSNYQLVRKCINSINENRKPEQNTANVIMDLLSDFNPFQTDINLPDEDLKEVQELRGKLRDIFTKNNLY